MARIKPFAAVRPQKAFVRDVAARPYDVLNSIEAKAEAGEKSLLHITKPEIDFDPMIDEHSQVAYDKAVANFKLWQDNKWLVQDDKPYYYIYAQTMGDRTQYGIVLCAHIEDYENGIIKKHELTLKSKEDDRMIHVRAQNANIEPVFFSSVDNERINEIIFSVVKSQAEYDFASNDGISHHFWVISDEALISEITTIFGQMDALYVADGHHRTAAAARVGAEKRANNPNHTSEEEYNYFMAVVFPESQLKIMDYNRILKDLNGLSVEEVLNLLKIDFFVEKINTEADITPKCLHNFSMYLDSSWYSLQLKAGKNDDSDPLEVLDVSVLSRLVLDKIFGIKDLRTDKRIDFVGGIRGLSELKNRVDSGEMAVAFALYPVSMRQLINIADSGAIMPPKTTWFEPKLRSGLAIHLLD